MNAAFVRVALRYLAGFLVARGIFNIEDADAIINDPDVVMMAQLGAGLALSAAVEYWYALAKRFGWRT